MNLDFVIHSNPSGATIFINGKEVGQTPLQEEYPAGRYVIVLSLVVSITRLDKRFH